MCKLFDNYVQIVLKGKLTRSIYNHSNLYQIQSRYAEEYIDVDYVI